MARFSCLGWVVFSGLVAACGSSNSTPQTTAGGGGAAQGGASNGGAGATSGAGGAAIGGGGTATGGAGTSNGGGGTTSGNGGATSSNGGTSNNGGTGAASGAGGSGGASGAGPGGAGATNGGGGAGGTTGPKDGSADIQVVGPPDAMSDGAFAACCTQIPQTSCRLKTAAYQVCYQCKPGCYDSIRPTAPVAPITKCNCSTRTGTNRCIKIENRCSVPIRAHGPTAVGAAAGYQGDLQPGECTTVVTNKGFRISGETGCASGTCDKGPFTLIEMNLGTLDWYDISHVDGANLPIGFYPIAGTFKPPPANGSDQCSCRSRECRVDIKKTTCHPENQINNASNQVVACTAQCNVASTADKPYACCRAPAAVPEVCLPTTPSIQADFDMFRFPCPQAYSFAYDENHEVDGQYVLCTCGAAAGSQVDYDAIFCP